jgi:hypothetical protein
MRQNSVGWPVGRCVHASISPVPGGLGLARGWDLLGWTVDRRRCWLLLSVGFFLLPSVCVAADSSCGQAGNLTYNCNFDNFVDRGSGNFTPDGWWPWVTMGSPAFDQDNHGSAPGAPAQRIWSDGGTWTAGLYQQVQVSAGRGYIARLDWAAVSAPNIERRVGIDPSGGTDPLSPQVVWGSSAWDVSRMPDLFVSSVAQASTITVFVWTHHPVSYGADQVFLDAVTLVEDPALEAQPTATPSPSSTVPEPTRKPPTRTPRPARPTDTPTLIPPSPTPTATSTSTPTATATQTPTFTPTSTWTSTPTLAPPTATPFPTRTPLPTIVPVAIAIPPAEAGQSPGGESVGSGGTVSGTLFLYLALGALLVSIVLGGIVRWLRQNARQAADGE